MTAGRVTHVTSSPERERRYAALREAMSGAGLDALVIYARGDEFVRGRVQYVSDIFTWAGWAIVVLPAEGAGRRAEQEVRRRMERVDVNILGIVLNRMDPRELVTR